MQDIILFVPDHPRYQGVDLVQKNRLQRELFCCQDPNEAIKASKRSRLIHIDTYPLDDGMLSKLRENGCTLLFSFWDFASLSGKARAISLSRASNLLRACARMGVDVKVCTFASDPLKLRSRQELLSFARLMGMDDSHLLKMDKEGLISTGESI